VSTAGETQARPPKQTHTAVLSLVVCVGAVGCAAVHSCEAQAPLPKLLLLCCHVSCVFECVVVLCSRPLLCSQSHHHLTPWTIHHQQLTLLLCCHVLSCTVYLCVCLLFCAAQSSTPAARCGSWHRKHFKRVLGPRVKPNFYQPKPVRGMPVAWQNG
jgi:hypothetical protein